MVHPCTIGTEPHGSFPGGCLRVSDDLDTSRVPEIFDFRFPSPPYAALALGKVEWGKVEWPDAKTL